MTYSTDTGGVIYFYCVPEDAPLNNNNNNSTVIGYLDSYFEHFDFHDTPVAVDTFDKFCGSCGSHFSSVHVPYEYTTIAVDPLDEFFDDCG